VASSFLFALLAGLASPTSAQDIYTRFEFGAQFSTVQQAPPGGGSKAYPGFGGRFDWNLSRRLALEAQADFFPGHAESLLYRQGGQTFEAVVGIRAKVIQTRHWSVFGLVRPGVLHFSDVLFYNGDPTTVYGSKSVNYFVLNFGGGIEYYMAHRWALRADIEGNPNLVSNAHFVSAGISTFVPGRIGDTTRLSFGLAYRPGVWIENEPERGVSGRWEFGPAYSTMLIAREGPTDGVRVEPGFGGYTSYKLRSVFYLDGDLLYYPRGTNSSGPHDGGEILQTLVGVKGGIRRNHFGFFGKVRPGFDNYSKALAGFAFDQSTGAFTSSYSRATNFVLDLGGIIEFYPAERSTLRLEVGDTHIFFGTRNINENGTTVSAPGGDLRHSVQIVLGYGWRF
jgi:Outer membrane protein beta-barrel domain